MPDYEVMYHRLFNAMTNAITILQEAQKDTEEIYVNSKSTVLELLKIEATHGDSSNNKKEEFQEQAK